MGGRNVQHNLTGCIDAGTKHCPCRLAESGDCIICSRLQGKEHCGCRWQGTCIYNEYVQEGFRMAGQRESCRYKLLEKKMYGENLVVMRVAVPGGFAQEASRPGSFVFIKAAGAEVFFYTPVSIMRADYDGRFIELAVKISGPKTRSLSQAEGWVDIRGVYHNGLLGAGKLLVRKPQKVLCLSRGLGVAPVMNYSRWAAGKDRIDFIIDRGDICKDFWEEYCGSCCGNCAEYRNLPMELSFREMDGYDVIILSASDYYQREIFIPESKKVLSNNHPMCCGEGICGACVCVDGDGTGYKMCKCNYIK